jgi:UDP-N-acetylglucosamine--N-acetylmuramyl-(pentapeptide) pyrophosphoryl-undecaprenol N-acetylglucosamine transferase
MSDLVISRAGANAICEILALKLPNILIPLSARASRGDQILNAQSFKKQGFSEVLEEDTLTAPALVETIDKVYHNRDTYRNAMEKSSSQDSIEIIIDLINQAAKYEK